MLQRDAVRVLMCSSSASATDTMYLPLHWGEPIETAVVLAIALLASVHVILHKRDVRSAAGWMGVIWLVPGIGGILYALLGINRIRRSAVRRREGIVRYDRQLALGSAAPILLEESLSRAGVHLADLASLVQRVTQKPLLGGNRIEPLYEGSVAYAAMIAAIDAAQQSVGIATYIFETNRWGTRFIEALLRAKARGVEVRVLIDDVGARYGYPAADRKLRRGGVRTARFMPALLFWRASYLNLRNHRKILLIDGRLGFTGGMNIRDGHVLEDKPAHQIRDLHFRLEGPVVGHLAEVFAEDWHFCTRERLEGEAWFPALDAVGPTLARGISDGPDEDLDRLAWTLHGALACARRRVLVISPYFLPDSALLNALSVAALRGVDVRVYMPEHVNLRLVGWAMWGQMREVMSQGVRVWLTRLPFDHTKLMIVDDEWLLLGSANWDARSLRLNFELNVECYDVELAKSVHAVIDERMSNALELTPEVVNARPLWQKLRDGVVRLLSPYL
jgi:cardiolipin synthase